MKSILLFAVIISAMALDLPSNFKTCEKSDPKLLECLTVAVKDAIIFMANKGLKEFKILPLEPLAIDRVKIGSSEGSVSLEQEYRNVKIHGLAKNFQLYNYQIDWDNLIFSANTFTPQVDFIADYKLEGKILLLPVRGEGRCNISMHNLTAYHETHYEKFEKDEDIYLRATKYIVKFSPKHVILQFDNLFNGDPTLGEQLNRFVNENSDLIFKEVKGPYEEAFGLVFVKLTNDIFTRVPMNKIYK